MKIPAIQYGMMVVLLVLSGELYSQEESLPGPTGEWAFSATTFYYIIPEDINQFSGVATADVKNLHLEGRYNYEDYHTGSMFAGRKFIFGDKLEFDITPMLGVIFGNTNGMAPGLELYAAYKKFDFYVESEWVIDFAGQENNYFYSWGELGINPLNSLHAGLSYQRTRLYHTSAEIEAGPFADFSFWKMTTGVYWFNPFSSSNLLILSLSIEF